MVRKPDIGPDQLLILGDEAVKSKNLRDAVKYYKMAVKQAPAHQKARLKLAWTYWHANRVKRAVKQMEAAIELDPDNAELTKTLGTWGLQLMKREMAQRWLERTVELIPRDADAWFLLGITHREQGQPRTALECWEKGLAIEPKNLDALNNTADLLVEIGDLTEAAVLFKRARRVDPKDPYAKKRLRKLKKKRAASHYRGMGKKRR